jgi:uncharacterized repeat protein (TIGR01451 family)
VPRRASRSCRLALAALGAALALPAGAPAATTLGQLTSAPAACDSDETFAQTASAAPEYAVRTAGVVTELRTQAQSEPDTRLNVLRPRGSDAYAVLASVAVAPSAGVVAVAVRVPVQPGDVLGLTTGTDPGQECAIPGSAGSPHDVTAVGPGAPPPSGEVTLASGAELRRLNVAATLEPDADGDGFGDETQDRCPGDAGRTSQDCSADLSVSQSPVEADVERDDVNVVAISVRNNGSSPARDVRVVEAMPTGLQLVATSPSSGGCAAGAPVDCTLPSIAPGATATVFAVVRAVSTGRKTLTATATSPTPDPNAANNTSEIAFEVGARRSVLAPGTFCRVPRLTGLTRSAARRGLEAAGCRLGRTTRRRFRSGRFSRVRAQSIPAGTRVATRTRVHVVLRRR